MTEQKLYEIALTLIPYIGVVNGKKLVAYCGGAEAVFCENKNALRQISGIHENIIKGIEKQGKGYSFDTLREIALFSVRTKIQEKFMAKNATYIES